MRQTVREKIYNLDLSKSSVDLYGDFLQVIKEHGIRENSTEFFAAKEELIKRVVKSFKK